METLEQLQSRFGERFEQSQWGERYVERFHNLFFDWIGEVGSMGLLTLIMIYQAGFYIGMRKLGLIAPHQVWYWFGLQLVCAPLGVVLINLVMNPPEWAAVIPLGSAIGALGGTTLWIARHAFTPHETITHEATGETQVKRFTLSYEALVALSLMCVISAQWIDNQFGFMQLMSQTLFFVLLGYLVAVTAEPEEIDVIEDEILDERESNYWYAATTITGLFMLYAFGIAWESDFSRAGIAVYELPIFLAAVFMTGSLISIAISLQERKLLEAEIQQKKGKDKKRKSQQYQEAKKQRIVLLLAFIALGWGAFFVLRRYIFISSAGNILDAALTNPIGPDPAGVSQAYTIYGLTGVTLAVIAIAILMFVAQAKRKFNLTAISAVFISLSLVIGGAYYVRNFAVGAMQNSGRGFTERGSIEQIVQPIVAANAIYESAASIRPGDTKLYLAWANSLITQANFVNTLEQQQALFQDVNEKREEALNASPLFIHSRTWELFEQRYNQYLIRLNQLGVMVSSQAQQPSQLPPGLQATNPAPANNPPPDLPFLLPTAPGGNNTFILPTSAAPGG